MWQGNVKNYTVFRLTKVLVLKFWISRFYCLVAARVCVLMNLMTVFCCWWLQFHGAKELCFVPDLNNIDDMKMLFFLILDLKMVKEWRWFFFLLFSGLIVEWKFNCCFWTCMLEFFWVLSMNIDKGWILMKMREEEEEKESK